MDSDGKNLESMKPGLLKSDADANRARWLTDERELSSAGEVADANGAVMLWCWRGRDFLEWDVGTGNSRACAC